MSRSKKLVATCALALGALGALSAAAPVLAGGPITPSERNSTSVSERNSTLAPISDSAVSAADRREVTAQTSFHVLERNSTLLP